VLASIRFLYPWLRHIFADSGYAGAKLRGALRRSGRWTVEIIKRSDTAKGFEVLPRRWVVERTFARLNRCRRLAKDFEATIASAVAWLFIAHIRVLTRKLAGLEGALAPDVNWRDSQEIERIAFKKGGSPPLPGWRARQWPRSNKGERCPMLTL